MLFNLILCAWNGQLCGFLGTALWVHGVFNGHGNLTLFFTLTLYICMTLIQSVAKRLSFLFFPVS